MSTPDSGLVLLDGRVRVRQVRRLVDVDFVAATKGNNRVLLLLGTAEREPLLHYALSQYEPLERSGHFAFVGEDEAELADDLPCGMEVVRMWLDRGHAVNVVVVEPVSAELVSSAVLIATGVPAPSAVIEAFEAAGKELSVSDEIFSSVFAERLLVYRTWWAAKEVQRRAVLQ